MREARRWVSTRRFFARAGRDDLFPQASSQAAQQPAGCQPPAGVGREGLRLPVA
jgi:hypothetical protein